ncbi:cellulose biosynthesis protein BcsQ [Pseudomonas sp. RT4P38]
MNRTDDISNLFNRFGASADSYLEFDSHFDYKEKPLALVPAAAEPVADAVIEALVIEPVNAVPVIESVKLMFAAKPLEIVADVRADNTAAVPAPLRHLLAEVALVRQAEALALNDEALRQALPHGRSAKCKARVVALVSSKGGVGKTTLAAALASTLHLTGGRTLAIDLDPQNALQYHLGVQPDVAGMGSASLTGNNWNELLLPGSADSLLLPFGALTEQERHTLEHYLVNDRHWLARQLARMALNENDVVILDTPPGRTVYLEQALDVADQIVVVTTADAASFLTLDQMDKLLGAPDTRAPSSVCSYVINQFDACREFSRDMHEVLKRRLGGQLLGVISLDHALGEALAYGRNPLMAPGSSPACQDLLRLSEQLKARVESARTAELYAS